jgi:hypothetical protein
MLWATWCGCSTRRTRSPSRASSSSELVVFDWGRVNPSHSMLSRLLLIILLSTLLLTICSGSPHSPVLLSPSRSGPSTSILLLSILLLFILLFIQAMLSFFFSAYRSFCCSFVLLFSLRRHKDQTNINIAQHHITSLPSPSQLRAPPVRGEREAGQRSAARRGRGRGRLDRPHALLPLRID